jgi:hypothetical protein
MVNILKVCISAAISAPFKSMWLLFKDLALVEMTQIKAWGPYHNTIEVHSGVKEAHPKSRSHLRTFQAHPGAQGVLPGALENQVGATEDSPGALDGDLELWGIILEPQRIFLESWRLMVESCAEAMETHPQAMGFHPAANEDHPGERRCVL